MTTANAFVGMDVSKARLEGAVRPAGDACTAANDPQGLTDLRARLAPRGPALIVLEATGGLDHPAAAALAAAGHHGAVISPRQAHDCAKAIGRRAQTDGLDADTLALFAERVRPPPRPRPDAAARAFEALLGRRRQLVATRAAEQHRLGSTSAAAVRKGLQAHSDWLSRPRAKVEKEPGQALEARPVWRAKDDVRQGNTGIGPTVARTLLAQRPELGTRTRQQIAALAGRAPRNRASGQRRGQRTIGGGRAAVRARLDLAALSAARYHPALRVFSGRLRPAGKAVKVRRVAVARTRLTMANAVLRDGRPWEPTLAPR